MKLPPLPAPYYWSSLYGDINIVSGTKDVPRDTLIDERRTRSVGGHIIGYVYATTIHARTEDGGLGTAAVAKTQKEAIQLMYNMFLMGELKGD